MTTDKSYAIEWVDDVFGIDPDDDNVDIIVKFASGDRYVATFFTIQNLRTLMERYRETGECVGGLYVWSTGMIVIERITPDNVERTIADLIQSGEFVKAFEGPIRDLGGVE